MLFAKIWNRFNSNFVTKKTFRISFSMTLNDHKLSWILLIDWYFFFRYPFHGQEHTGLFAKIRRGQFTLPDSISSRAKCLIRCLLRKDPTQRLTTEDVLIHPWVTLATPSSASCHASSSRESRRVSSSNLTHPVPSSAGHQTGGGGSNGGTNHSGGSGSNGAGPQQTPQMLSGVTTNPLGATPTQLLSSSTNLGSSHHHQFHHNHHSSVDQNNMDQIVPEFFPPHQDEMELSHLKWNLFEFSRAFCLLFSSVNFVTFLYVKLQACNLWAGICNETCKCSIPNFVKWLI